ncbi:DEAD/DEAH box helicase [Bacteroidales bacterium OttesenSCG-928-M11]|nr:DEAD/DEAH box helicase [Bacteroidales bacterium OttesenSCG-928-M11]
MITPDENNTIFRLAEDFINQTSEHLFLTGKAGTGKTTFLKYIRSNTHKRTIVAAPTGVAAVNADGVTLHSLFQLSFNPFLPDYSIASLKKNFFRFSKQKLNMLRQLELLIIDEVSMLRADTLDAIDTTLRIIRRNTLPFGGVQILYIGDLFQLPPVVKEDDWNLLKENYQGIFFFHAKVMEQTNPIYIELKTVYRQSDSIFVDLLNRIRNNKTTPNDLKTLNDLCSYRFEPDKEDNYITLTTHNYKADRINERNLQELSTPVRIFTGQIKDDFPDYLLPTEMQLQLKEGARVMFIKNDTEEPRRYYNGKIATISRIEGEQIYVNLPDTNKEILVTKNIWENKRFVLNKETGEIEDEVLGSFTQYPIRLAWAITIHKSQGLTFDKVIIDIGASFAAGQTYVALSRCTSLSGIVLFSKIHPGSIMTDPYAIKFSQNEKEETELLALFEKGKRKFWAARLIQYFEWKPIFNILKDLDKLLHDKEGEEYQPLRKLLIRFNKKARELEEISFRFKQQLTSIVQEGANEDIAFLKDRCRKAVSYFHKEVVSEILLPLQYFISEFKPTKKNKTFCKNITHIESDIILFLEEAKRVRYNNISLTEDMDLPIPTRKNIFDKE